MSRTGLARGQKRLPRHWRNVILDRDGRNCGICGKPIDDIDRATLDHIIPGAVGGRDRLENLQLAHYRCNSERPHDDMTLDLRQAQREGRLG